MAIRVRAREEAPAPRELTLVPAPRPFPQPRLVLAAIYAAAVAYHLFQSIGHVTPSVFGDELLYSKLAQSVASGHGLVLRGETVFFPAPLPILAQAPAWLVHSLASGYVLAKALNVAVMSAAAFPAYALARRLVRPSYALLAAAMTVAGPVLVYAPYLMSEALAYPVFLLALATIVRAFERPSRWMEAAVVAVSLAAVLTRVQFVVVPVAYLVAVAVRRRIRCHALSVGGLLAFAALPLVSGGTLLGTYAGATTLSFDPLAVVRWSSLTAALLPFAAGWLIVPGAILGAALLAVRPRSEADAAFGLLALSLSALVLLEVGLIGAGEANRSLERYAIYLVPLAAIAFFAYAERGAPWRRAYVALALGGCATAWLLDFPVRAGTSFSFDTATYSVYAQAAAWLGEANAATIFAGVPLVGGIVLALLPLRNRPVTGIAAATIALLLLGGAAAYAGDHSMTRGALALRAGDPPDWLDRSGLGPADYLELPGGSAHFGWLLEILEPRLAPARSSSASARADGYATRHARIDRHRAGSSSTAAPNGPGTLVVNDYGTAIEFQGQPRRAAPGTGSPPIASQPEPAFARWRSASARTAGRTPSSMSARGRRHRGYFRVALTSPARSEPATSASRAGTRTAGIPPAGRTEPSSTSPRGATSRSSPTGPTTSEQVPRMPGSWPLRIPSVSLAGKRPK